MAPDGHFKLSIDTDQPVQVTLVNRPHEGGHRGWGLQTLENPMRVFETARQNYILYKDSRTEAEFRKYSFEPGTVANAFVEIIVNHSQPKLAIHFEKTGLYIIQNGKTLSVLDAEAYDAAKKDMIHYNWPSYEWIQTFRTEVQIYVDEVNKRMFGGGGGGGGCLGKTPLKTDVKIKCPDGRTRTVYKGPRNTKLVKVNGDFVRVSVLKMKKPSERII